MDVRWTVSHTTLWIVSGHWRTSYRFLSKARVDFEFLLVTVFLSCKSRQPTFIGRVTPWSRSENTSISDLPANTIFRVLYWSTAMVGCWCRVAGKQISNSPTRRAIVALAVPSARNSPTPRYPILVDFSKLRLRLPPRSWATARHLRMAVVSWRCPSFENGDEAPGLGWGFGPSTATAASSGTSTVPL